MLLPFISSYVGHGWKQVFIISIKTTKQDEWNKIYGSSSFLIYLLIYKSAFVLMPILSPYFTHTYIYDSFCLFYYFPHSFCIIMIYPLLFSFTLFHSNFPFLFLGWHSQESDWQRHFKRKDPILPPLPLQQSSRPSMLLSNLSQSVTP